MVGGLGFRVLGVALRRSRVRNAEEVRLKQRRSWSAQGAVHV